MSRTFNNQVHERCCVVLLCEPVRPVSSGITLASSKQIIHCTDSDIGKGKKNGSMEVEGQREKKVSEKERKMKET